MSNLVATFSSSGVGSMIAVTRVGDDFNSLAVSHPSMSDNPVKALKALGYQLAHPDQAHYSLRSTMDETGYAKLYVVPV